MLFCILNDWRFPCPRTHMLHVRKLAEGFIQRGYHYRELQSAQELEHLQECDLLYVSNHFSCDPLHRPFAELLSRQLVARLAATRARLLLWHFHTLPDPGLLAGLSGHPALHIGEDLYPQAIEAESALKHFRQVFSVLPVRYASPFHPSYATFRDLPRRWDFNFVGAGYRHTLTSHCARNYNSLIRNTPPAISEPLRVNSFRLAEVNLVFHSSANVDKGIVVERFAEALSLGGLIFHDHPRITREFGGVAPVFEVGSTGDIDREFKQLRSLSPAERRALRQRAFEAWKTSGLSYFDQAGRILQAFSSP